MENRWLLMWIFAPFLSPAALPPLADGVYWYLLEQGALPVGVATDPDDSTDAPGTTGTPLSRSTRR